MDPNQKAQPSSNQDPFNNASPNTNQSQPVNQPASQPAPATNPFAPQPEPEVMRPTFQPPAESVPAQPQTISQPLPQPQQPQPQYNQPPANNTPFVQGQVYSGSGGVLPEFKPSNSSKKKRLMLGGGVLVAIVALSLGGVFALYLPNKPENVWNAGLSRSGKTIDKLVVSATEEKKLATIKNSEFSGTAEADIAGATYKGSFNSKYDSNQSNNTVTYRGDGQPEDFNLKVLTDLADGQDYPDIYFQITGLKSLGVDQFMPGLENYDGKWISVSSKYLKSVIPAENKDAKNPQFTQQDAAELSRIVSATSRDYLFSNDPSKAVLVRKSFVGTEKIENNISANHYVVGINKDNAKKYCRAMIESFMSAQAYKHIPGVNPDSIDKDKQDAVKSCESDIDKDVQDSDNFDMWIDKKLKLISKVRFTDTENKGTYVEVGQNYKKGDVVPLFMKFHSDEDKYEGTVTLEADMKKSVTKGSVNFESNNQDKYSFKASFEFKPFEGDVTIEKPANAISIEEVMKAFNVDPAELQDLGGTSQSF